MESSFRNAFLWVVLTSSIRAPRLTQTQIEKYEIIQNALGQLIFGGIDKMEEAQPEITWLCTIFVIRPENPNCYRWPFIKGYASWSGFDNGPRITIDLQSFNPRALQLTFPASGFWIYYEMWWIFIFFFHYLFLMFPLNCHGESQTFTLKYRGGKQILKARSPSTHLSTLSEWCSLRKHLKAISESPGLLVN